MGTNYFLQKRQLFQHLTHVCAQQSGSLQSRPLLSRLITDIIFSFITLIDIDQGHLNYHVNIISVSSFPAHHLFKCVRMSF